MDKINVGDSILVAFGDYTGGRTYVKNKNDKNYEIYDARLEPLQFNGAERKHGVTTVTSGNRFSLVLYLFDLILLLNDLAEPKKYSQQLGLH